MHSDLSHRFCEQKDRIFLWSPFFGPVRFPYNICTLITGCYRDRPCREFRDSIQTDVRLTRDSRGVITAINQESSFFFYTGCALVEDSARCRSISAGRLHAKK